MSNQPPESVTPPEISDRMHRMARSLARPVEKFLHIEAASGMVLMLMAVIALAWANSPWAESYKHFWHTPITLGFGDAMFAKDLHFWVNDILMVIFFFVVGLEIRREMHEGELATPKRAALPLAAALGGMLVPALLYYSVNLSTPAAQDGWSVPMATDIAFAVGVFALLGKRVPAALRILLLALAIIDDIGAIIIIAVFYTSELALGGFAVAGAGVVLVIIMQRIAVRNPWLYVVPGVIVWGGILASGVHPTVAGVMLGLLTPAKAWFGAKGFVEESERVLSKVKPMLSSGFSESGLLPKLNQIQRAQMEAVAPVTRLEAALHPWVAFGIMPLFALANAGVPLGTIDFAMDGATGVATGIILGLVVGKPLGIFLISWIAVKLGLASLPRGVTWTGVFVVGSAAGIGFTMALFIGALAFPDPGLLAVSKAAVLGASLVAGVISFVVGLMFLRGSPEVEGVTPDIAEKSTTL